MIMDERKNNLNTSLMQNLILENREKLSISGVNDVLSFDDQIAILETRTWIANSTRRKSKN